MNAQGSYVLGIDPSLTGTGVARIVKDGPVQVRHFGSTGRRRDTLVDRRARLLKLANAVDEWMHGEPLDPNSDHWVDWGKPQLAVIEGPSHGSKGGSAWDRAGLWWQLVSAVGVSNVAVCTPPTRAKWATGSGRADKAAVAAAVTRLWPRVELDCADCADALALATIGAQHLGWDVPSRAHHQAARAAVRWPGDAA